jgi:hypothetical protein
MAKHVYKLKREPLKRTTPVLALLHDYLWVGPWKSGTRTFIDNTQTLERIRNRLTAIIDERRSRKGGG